MSFYNFFERNILENPEILYVHEQKNYNDISNYYSTKVYILIKLINYFSLVAKI